MHYVIRVDSRTKPGELMAEPALFDEEAPFALVD